MPPKQEQDQMIMRSGRATDMQTIGLTTAVLAVTAPDGPS
jgi:hypothetical protein